MNKGENMEVKINKLHCTHCGWEWIPRKTTVYVCPHCHVYTWDKPRPRGKYGKRTVSDNA